MDLVNFLYLTIVVINLAGLGLHLFNYLEGKLPGIIAFVLGTAHFIIVAGFSTALLAG